MVKKAKWYISWIIIGFIFGYFFYYFQSIQWQGQALLRLGSLSQRQNQLQTIEPIANVIERIKSVPFIEEAASKSGNKEIHAILDANDGGITIKSLKNSDLIVVTVKSKSAELAKIAITSVANELIFKHKELLDNYCLDITKELKLLDSDIPAIEKKIAQLLDENSVQLSSLNSSVRNFDVVRLKVLQHSLDNKLSRASILKEYIASYNMHPTILMEPVFVTQSKIFKTPLQSALLMMLLSCFLSFLIIKKDYFLTILQN